MFLKHKRTKFLSSKQVGNICIMDSFYINYIPYRTHLIKLGKGGRHKLKWSEKRGECIGLGLLSALFDVSPFFEVCNFLVANICPRLHNHECQEELDLVITVLSVSPTLFCSLS